MEVGILKHERKSVVLFCQVDIEMAVRHPKRIST